MFRDAASDEGFADAGADAGEIKEQHLQFRHVDSHKLHRSIGFVVRNYQGGNPTNRAWHIRLEDSDPFAAEESVVAATERSHSPTPGRQSGQGFCLEL